MAADIPVVFFNKEPLPEVLSTWDKAYYVGAKAEESGIIEGQLSSTTGSTSRGRQERRRQHPVRDAVGSRRPPGRAVRTVESVKAINAAGIETEELQREIGDWNVPLAQEQMSAILAQPDAIEFVLANNDTMALGAIEALKANGYFGADGKFMPVVGVDATAAALDSMRAGPVGTVLNDAVNQGTATFNLACVLAGGGTPTPENTGYTIDGQYVWVPYVPGRPTSCRTLRRRKSSPRGVHVTLRATRHCR